MVRDIMLTDSEFGVVLARDGGLLDTGCTARIDRILREFEDGRLDVLAIGQSRFRIVTIDSERSYLRAEVEELEDDDFAPVAESKLNEALLLHAQCARQEGENTETPGPDEPLLSFVLGAVSPDMGFRQVLLGTRSEARRIELVAAHLAQLIRRREIEHAMKNVARTNGHGKHLKG